MALFGTSLRFAFTFGSLLSLVACDDPKCFAPDKNLDTAYEEGAVGCGCSAKDEDQCIDGVALVCEQGRWQAVQDGPCLPDIGTCGDKVCSEHEICVVDPDLQPICVSTLLDGGASESDDGQVSEEAGSSEAGASSATGGEVCGKGVCTEVSYCSRSLSDAGWTCLPKGEPGAPCAVGRMCLSGECRAASCQKDERPCMGTWDCSEDIALTICAGRDCHVCLQAVDKQQRPVLWGAVEPASCPCPAPSVISL